jgi:hypothetical protein
MKARLAVTTLSIDSTMCFASEGPKATSLSIEQKMQKVEDLRNTTDRDKEGLKALEVR